MAKQTNDYKPIGFRIEPVVIASGDGTSKKALVAAGADDSVIVQLSAVSISTSDGTIRLYLYDGATDYLLAEITIPAESGLGTIPAVDMMELPFIYNASFPLETGWSLRAAATSAVSDDVTIITIVTDY